MSNSITNKAKTGDQVNYSLVDRNTPIIDFKSNANPTIKNTISAVPREEANIEAEGGETVIGDINNDGYLEHQKIVGKRHTQGGVPLNIPEGSFIYSDTKDMMIKDPEVLSLFGITSAKRGYTPAEIAKKYQINDYMQTLKDDKKDHYAKETAQIMLDSNLKKLGMLALVQESMKGFPDGLPAIAESVVTEMQGGGEESQQEQPEMQYGGKYKYQNAGSVRTLPKELTGASNNQDRKTYSNSPVYDPETGQGLKLYRGLVPVYVKKINDKHILQNYNSSRAGQPVTAYYAELTDGEKLDKKSFDDLMNNKTIKSFNPSVNDTYSLSPKVNKKTIHDTDGNPVKDLNIYSGDKLNFKGIEYTVINPDAEKSNSYKSSGKRIRDALLFDNTHGIVQVSYTDDKGVLKNKFIESEDIADAYKFDKSLVKVTPNETWRSIYSGKSKPKPKPSTTVKPIQPVTPTAQKQAVQPVKKNTVTPAKVKIKVTKEPKSSQPLPENASWTDEEFEFGGSYLPTYQVGAEVNNKEFVKWEYSKKTGNRRPVYSDGTKGPVEETGVVYDVADAELRKSVMDKGYTFNELPEKFRYKKSAVGPQTKQTGFTVDPDSGFYYNESQGAPRPGVEGLEVYVDKHREIIEQYPGGVEKWKQDQVAAGGKENPAMTFLLKNINGFIGPIAGGKEYVDLKKRGALIPGVENYNLPGISKVQSPAQARPAKEEVIGNDIDIKYVEKPVIRNNNRNTGWWLQDRVNFAGAMTDNAYKYDPAMASFDFQIPGYTLEDPTRQLAAVQERDARMNDMLSNSTAGNVAGASMFNNSGQSLADSANIIAGVENRNVQTVNNAMDRGAQYTNQEEQLNEQAKQKYISEMATSNQNYDNSRNNIKWRQIAAFNNGVTNNMRKKQMEQILFPQAAIDPITGDVDWSGTSQNMFGVDTYSPAYSTGNTRSYDMEEYRALMREPGMTPNTAARLLTLKYANKSAKSSANPYSDYFNSGQTLPSYGAMSPGFDDEEES